MKSNYELKEIDIKNCTCYCLDDIIDINDLDPNNILLDEKIMWNFFYDVAYETPYGAKSLHNIFDKVDECIRKYDKTKYLGLFHFDEKYEKFLK